MKIRTVKLQEVQVVQEVLVWEVQVQLEREVVSETLEVLLQQPENNFFCKHKLWVASAVTNRQNCLHVTIFTHKY
jgi:hypothetical protein